VTTVDDQRAQVVSIARSYIGTPYHHMGRIKGVGVDCATLLVLTYVEAGIIQPFDLPFYSPQWHLNRGAESYLEQVIKRAREIDTPLPGDVVVFRYGRTFSHGGVVTQWPNIVHAYVGVEVTEDNVEQAQWLNFIGESDSDQGKLRPRKFFTPW
jgi:cell wall-associated NlpC family hydrolase